MGFRINTNVAALNAKANADLNSKSLDASLSRLSSGLRINSAADDASGMAIADSLRSQANTLGQAISNGNDALGILQTADKAMDEQLKILDTIKTKATQAAQDGQSLKTRTMLHFLRQNKSVFINCRGNTRDDRYIIFCSLFGEFH